MRNMSIDTYKLTSMEEPSDEVLSQLMREAAEDAREANTDDIPEWATTILKSK